MGQPTHPQPALRIYVRAGGAEIRLVGDGRARPGGRLADVAFCETADDVRALETACRAFLDHSKMPAGPDGWHPLPASSVPVLLQAARNAVWAAAEPDAPPTAPDQPEAPLQTASDRDGEAGWTRWTSEQTDALRMHAVNGMTAKQIALRMGRSHEAVQRKLNRLGIHLREMPRGDICFRLPFDSKLMVDGLCQASKLPPSSLFRYWTIKATAEPEVYGAAALRRHLKTRERPDRKSQRADGALGEAPDTIICRRGGDEF